MLLKCFFHSALVTINKRASGKYVLAQLGVEDPLLWVSSAVERLGNDRFSHFSK